MSCTQRASPKLNHKRNYNIVLLVRCPAHAQRPGKSVATGRYNTNWCSQTNPQQIGGSMGEHHQRATGMHTDRTRDDNGELRQKRGDTLVGNIEREYGVDFGVRSDMRLNTLRDQTGLTSIEDLLRHARNRG